MPRFSDSIPPADAPVSRIGGVKCAGLMNAGQDNDDESSNRTRRRPFESIEATGL
jgi:hypothetical protein